MFGCRRPTAIWIAAICAVVLGCGDPDPGASTGGDTAGIGTDAGDAAASTDGHTERKCNGHAVLCGRRLDEVTLLRTHNSHATYAKGYHKVAANHQHAIPKQLADGVRALNVDVYKKDGKLLVCHGYCELGNEPFSAPLAEIKAFMDANPNEVIVLGLQNETTRAAVVEGFKEAGLAVLAHTQPKGKPWPTLGELIDSGRRLVLFAGGSGSAQWLHNTGSFIYGTNWGTKTKADFTCKLNQPAFEHGLFELDHTLTNPWAKIEFADANDYAFLLERAKKCAKSAGKNPSLISVDWYAVGDALKVVNALNGVGP